jgi:hypothetical protein
MTSTPAAPTKRAPAKTTGAKPVAAKKDPPAKVAKPGKTAAIVRGANEAKPAIKSPQKREKLVRDSFTIPKSEYATLGELKERAAGLARPVKKSELLRAGLKALAAMGDPAFLAVLREVPEIKTGRPAAVPAAPAAKTRKGGNAATPAVR